MSNGCCLTWFKWVNSTFLVTLIIQTARMKKRRPWELKLENLFTQMTLPIASLSRMWLGRRKSYRPWTHVSLFIQKPLQDPDLFSETKWTPTETYFWDIKWWRRLNKASNAHPCKNCSLTNWGAQSSHDWALRAGAGLTDST